MNGMRRKRVLTFASIRSRSQRPHQFFLILSRLVFSIPTIRRRRIAKLLLASLRENEHYSYRTANEAYQKGTITIWEEHQQRKSMTSFGLSMTCRNSKAVFAASTTREL